MLLSFDRLRVESFTVANFKKIKIKQKKQRLIKEKGYLKKLEETYFDYTNDSYHFARRASVYQVFHQLTLFRARNTSNFLKKTYKIRENAIPSYLKTPII